MPNLNESSEPPVVNDMVDHGENKNANPSDTTTPLREEQREEPKVSVESEKGVQLLELALDQDDNNDETAGDDENSTIYSCLISSSEDEESLIAITDKPLNLDWTTAFQAKEDNDASTILSEELCSVDRLSSLSSYDTLSSGLNSVSSGADEDSADFIDGPAHQGYPGKRNSMQNAAASVSPESSLEDSEDDGSIDVPSHLLDGSCRWASEPFLANDVGLECSGTRLTRSDPTGMAHARWGESDLCMTPTQVRFESASRWDGSQSSFPISDFGLPLSGESEKSRSGDRLLFSPKRTMSSKKKSRENGEVKEGLKRFATIGANEKL